MNHRWTDKGSKLTGTPSGCEEHERVCDICGLTKVTIHYPKGHQPGRAWVLPNGKRLDRSNKYPGTPPCNAPEPQEVRAI